MRFSEMLVFGERRPSLFKEAPFNLEGIIQSGKACRRLFVKGLGIVKDPTLRRHPDALKGEIAREVAGQVAPLRPMDGTWASGYRSWGAVSPYGIYRGFSPEALALFSHIPEGLRVVGPEQSYSRLDWMPEQFDTVLDGRNRLGIMAHGIFSGVGCILERTIITDETGITLRCHLPLVFGRDAPAEIGYHCRSVAGVIAIIAAADAERLVRRSLDNGTSFPVRIELTSVEGDAAADFVAGLAKRHLSERQVRIEPPGWSGDLVEVDGPDMEEPEGPVHSVLSAERDDWLSAPIDLDF